MVDLEPLDLLRDVFARGQERRHGYEGAQRFGHSIAKLQARQRDRGHEKRNASVDERHARVNRGNGPENREYGELSRAQAQLGKGDQWRRQNDRGRRHDRCNVNVEIQSGRDARGPNPKPAKTNRTLEFAASSGKQVVTGVAAAHLLRRRATAIGRARRRNGKARDVELAVARSARQVFDRTSVEVAGRKIHVPKCTPQGKDVIDETIPFEQYLPINLGDHPQARHDVADGHVRGPFAAMDLTHSRIRRHPLFRESHVEPCQRRCELRILIAKPMHELDREGLGKRPSNHGPRKRPTPAPRRAH